MKKLLTAIALILGLSIGAQARSEYEHGDASLPEAAKMTIKKHFKSKVSLVKIERRLGSVHEYEVILTDGTEIEFDSKGNWDKVETAVNKSVPSSLVPAGIANYVKNNYKGVNIVSLDKERYGYSVELSNGLDMEFDKNGNFLRFD